MGVSEGASAALKLGHTERGCIDIRAYVDLLKLSFGNPISLDVSDLDLVWDLSVTDVAYITEEERPAWLTLVIEVLNTAYDCLSVDPQVGRGCPRIGNIGEDEVSETVYLSIHCRCIGS